MALASVDDVRARLRRDLTVDEIEALPAVIDEAGDLVEGYCGRTFVDPVPSAVSRVVAKVAARAIGGSDADAAAVSSEQYTAGPFTVNRTYAGDGSNLWLGASEKQRLRPYRISMVSMALVSDRTLPP